MVGPTPRTALASGRSIEERLTILELRQWIAPERLAGVLSAVVDANEQAGSGWFRIGEATLNSPTPGQNYMVEQYEFDSTTRYQLAERVGSPATQIFAERWTRTRTGGGAWTAWRLISLPTTNFTPVPDGITIGNGTASGQYGIADGMLYGRISVTFGSTTSITSSASFEHPPIPYGGGTRSSGQVRMIDVSAGVAYTGVVLLTGTRVLTRAHGTTGASSGTLFTREIVTSATVPFTWAVGDSIVLDFEYPII